MNRVKRSRWLWTGTLIVGCSAVACGEDFVAGEGGSGPSEVPCNEDPWSCTPPQSCWVFSDFTYQCMNVGDTPAGASCTAMLGTSECEPGHVCHSGESVVDGVCVPFCDPTDATRACSSGDCIRVRYQHPETGDLLPPIWICVP